MTGKWIEIFKAGRQTDSAGNTREWTEQDLDKVVEQYNSGSHDAPIVVGHPEHNSPAFGWVESLKREGKLLYAKFKEVMPEFADLVKAGTYKKRSISLYPDLTLRHIGFLGGMPPAVKGLADIAFADGDSQPMVIEFSDWRMSTLGRIVMRMRDYLIEKEGADKADGIISSWDVQDMLNPPPEPDDISGSYTEPHKEESMKPEEVQALVTKAVTAVTQQFSEQIKGLTQKLDALTEESAAASSASQRREFREFLMTPEMQKRVNEGSREATINHMMNLVSAAPVEFGEGEKKTSRPALDVYKDQLKSLPEVVDFREAITKEKAGHVSVDGLPAEAIAKKAVEFQESEAKAGRTVTMTDAVNHVAAGGR